MTGFARGQGEHQACAWTWEVKSVNGKGLDVRTRLPPGLEGLDLPARERVRKRFHRGNVSLQLNAHWNETGGRFRINREVLGQVLALLPELRNRLPDARPPSLDGILNIRGIVEPAEEMISEEARAALEAALLEGLERVLERLAGMRNEEGTRLLAIASGHLDGIEALCRQAEALAATQPEAIRTHLGTQIRDLLSGIPALPEDRLAQEVALLVAKADVREELDRLASHLAAARRLLAGGEAAGRKLDFLCQEFNREANTLCSKAADVALTRVGLDLKAAIEQLREQVQNIE